MAIILFSPFFLFNQKINPVRFKSLWVAGENQLQFLSYPAELISGYGMRNNEDPVMGAFLIKKLEGETNKIVSVPRNQTPFSLSRKFQLF
jgi:hypothetical protein